MIWQNEQIIKSFWQFGLAHLFRWQVGLANLFNPSKPICQLDLAHCFDLAH
jgi:hypothetical protein